MALLRPSARSKYRDRARGLASLLRADSTAIRVLIFIAMSAIFFLFLKITEKKVPTGLAPDSTIEQLNEESGSKNPAK